MDKRARNIGILLFVVLAVLFIMETLAPKPVNWRMSYTSGDKIPFGAFVLYDQLEEIFPDRKVDIVNETPLDFLNSHENDSTSNYIFINNYLEFDKVEVKKLLEFAERGNKVFIATSGTYGPMADTLNLESNYTYYGYNNDTIRTRLVNQSFKDRTYVYTKGSSYRYFESYDTLQTKVLGEVLPFEPYDGFLTQFFDDNPIEDNADDEDDVIEDVDDIDVILKKNRSTPQVNFIEVNVGKGAIYYNLNPIAYTNYYMLDEGKPQYVAETLSYLNNGPVYWDDYGKSGRRVVRSPMRYILSQSALTWAYWIATVCVILFFFFHGKRRQRIIPVVEPLENATVEFSKTIGHMYYQRGDVSNVINKKIGYFLERLRSKYFVSTQKLDDRFIKQLAIKAGKDHQITEDVIKYILLMRNKAMHNEEELKQLNRKIDAFLKS